MSETTPWPNYPTGPRDAIFCLGMISINFAELSSVFEYVFSEVFGLDTNGGRAIVCKIGPDNSIDLAIRRVKSEENRINNANLLERFILGYKLCSENRNEFIHSELAYIVTEKAFFVRPTRKGNMVGYVASLSDLRECADSMKAFSNFGRSVINANGWPLVSELFASAPKMPFPLPDMPFLPRRMTFQEGPIPL